MAGAWHGHLSWQGRSSVWFRNPVASSFQLTAVKELLFLPSLVAGSLNQASAGDGVTG